MKQPKLSFDAVRLPSEAYEKPGTPWPGKGKISFEVRVEKQRKRMTWRLWDILGRTVCRMLGHKWCWEGSEWIEGYTGRELCCCARCLLAWMFTAKEFDDLEDW